MSVDIYLLPLQPDDDYDAAMETLASLRGHTGFGPNGDVREAAEVITRMDRRYTRFEMDYAAVAAYDKTTVEEARRRYDHVELNGVGVDGAPDANDLPPQSRGHPLVLGATADEIDQYVIAICGKTGLAAVDPQARRVWRLQPDGTLA